VTVCIIDILELVDVHKQKPEGPAVPLQPIETALKVDFPIPSVPDLRELIDERESLQFHDVLFGFVKLPIVCKDLDRARYSAF
jgi:hypothetical protein